MADLSAFVHAARTALHEPGPWFILAGGQGGDARVKRRGKAFSVVGLLLAALAMGIQIVGRRTGDDYRAVSVLILFLGVLFVAVGLFLRIEKLENRLSLLLFLVLQPFLAWSLYTGYAAVNQRNRDAALRLATATVGPYQQVISTTRDMLILLSQVVKDTGPIACTEFYRALIKQFPFYTNVAVAELGGAVSCSAVQLTAPINAGDQGYFRRAVATRGFSFGEYQPGLSVGSFGAVSFGYPILNDAGEVARVAFATVDLAWLNRLAQQVNLPPGSTVTVVDRQGTVLARSPDSQQWIGKPLPDGAIVRSALEKPEGVDTGKGPDGKNRVYGFVRLGGDSQAGLMFVSVGVLPSTRGRPDWLFFVVVMLVFVGGRMVALSLIVRPIIAVIAAAERIRAGDFAARTGMKLRELEFGKLTTAFDEMAKALEERAGQLHASGEKLHRRLRQLQALRSIDLAILGSLDLRVGLGVVATQAIDALRADAAAILIFQPRTNQLEYVTGAGFQTDAVKSMRLKLGDGHIGQAALERRMVSVPNISDVPESFERSSLTKAEGFESYHAVPLVAKGTLKGVLEVFHRRRFGPDEEWLEFLEALAGQAAITIDSAALFGDLQRANMDLLVAYDATLEGWSKALDLRDKETEDHTLRVTEMTVEVARAMHVSEEDLTHIRRGALLHDIGKMGVPDRILLKPGPLADDEWATMRQHPVYAFQLLSPIPYLRQSVDIPYCHHEKWDGTGYPRGLKGTEIPLAARIFAVVDVWDALRSDRPYRQAWPEEKVLAYIQEQAGKHFDPEIVEVFQAVVRSKGGSSRGPRQQH